VTSLQILTTFSKTRIFNFSRASKFRFHHFCDSWNFLLRKNS